MSVTKPDRLVRRALHRRIAVVFDFDETLAPNTTDALLQHLGLDPEHIRSEHVQPLVDDGWESRLAEAHVLTSISNGPHGPVTAETFTQVAEGLETYPGVPAMFDRVIEAARQVAGDIDVEFHLLTAGFVHIPEATAIADRFTSIIGGHWAFDGEGCIVTPKSTVGHYAKVRHLMAIAKGVDSIAGDRDDDVDAYRPEHEWHVPFEQMVFVGDGDSDLPSFDFLQSHAGLGVAVRQASSDSSWESQGEMRDGRQVVGLHQSDYSDGSPLLETLRLCARLAATRILLLETGR